VNPAGLAAGTYTGTVTISASGATGSPKTVAVTLNVSAPSSGLVGAWGFDEASGTTTADSSGKGNAGTSGGGGKTTTTAHGSCTADDTTVNAQYTIQGSGFKPGELLNVWVKDSGGTQTLFPPVDANGQFSATSWASWAGAYSVTVYNNGGRRLVWLTSCSFSVAP